MYTSEQMETGRWVRELSARSYRGWKAFYHSYEWRKKRKEILKRDHNQCQLCRAKGRYRPADTVHHVKHLKDAPELALTNDNLLSLCEVCHEKVHPEKQFKNKGYKNREKW